MDNNSMQGMQRMGRSPHCPTTFKLLMSKKSILLKKTEKKKKSERNYIKESKEIFFQEKKDNH